MKDNDTQYFGEVAKKYPYKYQLEVESIGNMSSQNILEFYSQTWNILFDFHVV